jgi:hypothetical protein
MARVRSTARVTRDREEAEAIDTAPISEVMRQSGLVVTEGAIEKGAPAAEAEQDVDEEIGDEEEEDYSILISSKPGHLDFEKSIVSKADMPIMIKLGYFREAEKKLIRFAGEETTPTPKDDEVVVFKSFFRAGLRFSLNEMIGEVLDNYEIYLHQLTPNVIVKLNIFIWALRSQGMDPNAEAFCRVHELHYQTKAREDGLYENFGCYNIAYHKDMKALVLSYRTKWPTGWKSEWFYIKADEKKREKLKTLVMSSLSLSFGMTRPLCNMKPGLPCQLAIAEFRVVAEHISTRDLVQEYLVNRVSLTLSEWSMPKLKGSKKKGELVRLPYRIKFEKQFKEPCQEWLEMIETMYNEILGNYTKKEDQLMTAAFGIRPKRRLNRVMDALNFEYLDYERLNKGAEGPKRKRIISVMSRQAARMVKEDEKALKKRKSSPEPKMATSKKRKTATLEPKMAEIEEEAPSTPSATEVEEILKAMTESLPIKLLSPLGPHLTKLLQKKDETSATKTAVGPKKRRIVTVTQAIEETPPPASVSKMTSAAEATNLESTLSDIDKVLLDLAAKEAVAATEGVLAAKETDVVIEEAMAVVPGKGKEIAEDTSEDQGFCFQNLIGQELSKAEKELHEYAISYGYQPGAMLFGVIDEEALGCIRDRTRAKIISTLSKSVGFSKLEADISSYRRQHIIGSLFYSNFKLKFFPQLFIVFYEAKISDDGYFVQSMLLSKALRMQQDIEDKKNEIIIEGLEKKIKD